MAGAGYKLFNTGDVLTAAQVNTYLMEQTVMVFADAAARTAALSGVVSEGMISYLKDTNAVEVYNGSAWVASDDPNAIQNTIVDAKGDLISASAADTPARLAVGNNGESLVADSSASTGLRWQGNFAAGKNRIINGDFNIWQRGTSFSNPISYTADRFIANRDGNGTFTVTREAFTPGAGSISGYESQYFMQLAISSLGTTSYFYMVQPIEDVRSFADQTVTFSFWARVSSGTIGAGSPYIRFEQNFGSGGSATVNTDSGGLTFTSSWARYTFTTTLPSISGKTVGANSYLGAILVVPLTTTATLQTWGWQVERGNTATAFQTATGTLAGELQACRRYLPAYTYGTSLFGYAYQTNGSVGYIAFDTPARVNPTGITIPTLSGNFLAYNKTNGSSVPSSVTLNFAGRNGGSILWGSTATAGDPTRLEISGSDGYILFTGCEL